MEDRSIHASRSVSTSDHYLAGARALTVVGTRNSGQITLSGTLRLYEGSKWNGKYLIRRELIPATDRI